MYNTYWRCSPYGDWYERERDWGYSPSPPRERAKDREMEDAMEQEIIYYEQEIMNVSWEEEEEQEAAANILAEKEQEGTLTDEQKARIERNRKEVLVKRARFLEQESAAAPKLSKPPALETLDDLMARQKEVFEALVRKEAQTAEQKAALKEEFAALQVKVAAALVKKQVAHEKAQQVLQGKGGGGREEGIVPEAKPAGKAAQTAAKVAAILAGKPGIKGARVGGASREPQIKSIDKASAVCPVCKKRFPCAKTMTHHLRDKRDAQHTHFRVADGNTMPRATTKTVCTVAVLTSHDVRPSVLEATRGATQAAALHERGSDSSTGDTGVSKRKKLPSSDILRQPSGAGAQDESNTSGGRDESDKDDVVTITGVTRVDDPVASIDLCQEAEVAAAAAGAGAAAAGGANKRDHFNLTRCQAAALNERGSDRSTGDSRVSKRKTLSSSEILGQRACAHQDTARKRTCSRVEATHIRPREVSQSRGSSLQGLLAAAAMTQQQHLKQQLLQQQKEKLRQELQGERSGVNLRQFPRTGGRGGPCPLAADLTVTRQAYQGLFYHRGGPAGPGPGYDACQTGPPDPTWGYGGGRYDGGGYVEGGYGHRGCGGAQSARPQPPAAGGYYGSSRHAGYGGPPPGGFGLPPAPSPYVRLPPGNMMREDGCWSLPEAAARMAPEGYWGQG